MLNIRNFSEAAVQDLQDNLKISSLKELFTLQEEDVRFLGPENSKNFIKAIEELRSTPMYDYQILGALGFSNTAKAKWKLICDKLTIDDLLGMHEEDLYSALISIKGLGKETANIIATERDDFVEDILAVCNFMTIRKSKGSTDSCKVIRFTGVRNKELCDLLNQQGHDAGEGSVSKKTDFLIVPYDGYTSTKTKKASEYGIPIMSMENFVHDMAQLLS
jgi:NAD-dependent DNA ligase